eukprot:scaffold647_cov70-Phaeocystis_antarctica.AAC.8
MPAGRSGVRSARGGVRCVIRHHCQYFDARLFHACSKGTGGTAGRKCNGDLRVRTSAVGHAALQLGSVDKACHFLKRRPGDTCWAYESIRRKGEGFRSSTWYCRGPGHGGCVARFARSASGKVPRAVQHSALCLHEFN